MELSERIQKLRKERGMTQEQFAEQLFVSRTAVSKWETGRGMPGMESLKMIAKLCGITLDDLLRAEEVAAVAEEENRGRITRLGDQVEGICNLAAVLGLCLPLYKVKIDRVFYSVPLWQYNGWLAAFYWILPVLLAVLGLGQVIGSRDEKRKGKDAVSIAGMLLNAAEILLMILSGQPYPGVLYFALFLFKVSVKLAVKK